MSKKVLTSLLVTVGSLSIPAQAYAAEVSFGVYPPITQIRANPKAKVSFPLKILNNAEDSIELTPQLRPFRSSDKNNGSIEYYTTKQAPAADLTFLKTVKIEVDGQEAKTINLYPKEYKTVTVSFPAPSTTHRDYYFSVVFVNEQKQETSEDTLAYINTGVAGNVLLSVGDSSSTQGYISEFKTDGVVLQGPVKFNLVVDNTTDTFHSVSGSIAIYDMFGNKAGTIPLKSGVLISDASRIMTAQDQHTSPNRQIAWNEKFLMGFYTGKATIQFDRTHTVTSEVHFFAIPLIALFLLSIIMFIILGIFLRVLKKLNFKEA